MDAQLAEVARTSGQAPAANLRNVLDRNRRNEQAGVYAVCSSHPWVLDAAIEQAKYDGSLLLVESTCSQVNQEGGYSGQTPEQFAAFVRSVARRAGLPGNKLVLGGDHLGPYPWRNGPAAPAMEKARELVRSCVAAGYQKVHLDASMPCADDGPQLAPETIADRAAVLCQAAEDAAAQLPPGASRPLFVMGTEVPPPGGETAEGAPPAVTRAEDVRHTLDVFHAAFAARELHDAWERTIGLVVQPGVEFGDDVVFAYDRVNARLLSSALPAHPKLVYEAHSTDYQMARALSEMVGDHFAILKVGPWLTFAFREAVFALSAIEAELLGGKRDMALSNVRKALEDAMLQQPSHWCSYYHGNEDKVRLSRAYSYSDRCRYYWNQPLVQQEISRLLENLSSRRLPLTLISQYLPSAYGPMREGVLAPGPAGIIRHHIRQVLGTYAQACGNNVSDGSMVMTL